mgnify:CR=1 FL=1
MGKRSKAKNHQTSLLEAEAIVPRSIVQQAMDFTAPRGRMEMGGLLIGHIDSDGVTHVVTGFFPEQLRATPGYCEFDGSWVALAASACNFANENSSDSSSPDLRVVGWIHTHPDLGLFLSSIDVSTYSSLRGMVPDSRFIAIVVDPLRNEDGVFPSEKRPRHYVRASGHSDIEVGLRERYHLFLNRLQEIRRDKGDEGIPAVLPGDLRVERLLRGDSDDSQIAMRKGFQQLKSRVWQLEDEVTSYRSSLKGMSEIRRQLESIRSRLKTLESRERNFFTVFSRLFG